MVFSEIILMIKWMMKKLNNLSNKIFNEFEQLKYLGECYDLLINLRGQRKQIITSIQELEKFKKKLLSLDNLKIIIKRY